MDRRNFFGLAAGGGAVAFNQMQGALYLKLTDLPKYSDQGLAALIPLLAADVTLDGDRVLVGSEVSCKFTVAEMHAVDMFQGIDNLATIAARLAQRESVEFDEAFRICREVFLRLATRTACFPIN